MKQNILQANQKFSKEGLTPFFFYGRAIVKKITFEKGLTNLVQYDILNTSKGKENKENEGNWYCKAYG